MRTQNGKGYMTQLTKTERRTKEASSRKKYLTLSLIPYFVRNVKTKETIMLKRTMRNM
jgi:hypothetical protein